MLAFKDERVHRLLYVVQAVLDTTLASGTTIVIGATLESMLANEA